MTTSLTPEEIAELRAAEYIGIVGGRWTTDQCLRLLDIAKDHARLIGAEVATIQRENDALRAQVATLSADYYELLYAVATKYPSETRHQTALRYIHQAENRNSDADAAKETP